jgi:hypothetical protein
LFLALIDAANDFEILFAAAASSIVSGAPAIDVDCEVTSNFLGREGAIAVFC